MGAETFMLTVEPVGIAGGGRTVPIEGPMIVDVQGLASEPTMNIEMGTRDGEAPIRTIRLLTT